MVFASDDVTTTSVFGSRPPFELQPGAMMTRLNASATSARLMAAASLEEQGFLENLVFAQLGSVRHRASEVVRRQSVAQRDERALKVFLVPLRPGRSESRSEEAEESRDAAARDTRAGERGGDREVLYRQQTPLLDV